MENNTSQTKKPVYKNWWFWLIAVFAVIAIYGGIRYAVDPEFRAEVEANAASREAEREAKEDEKETQGTELDAEEKVKAALVGKWTYQDSELNKKLGRYYTFKSDGKGVWGLPDFEESFLWEYNLNSNTITITYKDSTQENFSIDSDGSIVNSTGLKFIKR